MSTEKTLTPSETTWQVRMDAALDRLSYLEDKLKRATLMVEDLIVRDTRADRFDLTEVMMVLVETSKDSDIRRFAGAAEPVLVSSVPETKEETP